MGTYREILHVINGRYEWTETETYRQPGWRHHVSVVLNAITARTGRLEVLLDGPLERLHDLRCHDDCGGLMTSHQIKPEYRDPEARRRAGLSFGLLGESDPDYTEELSCYYDVVEEVRCKRLPFSANVDITLYHFGEKDRVNLGRKRSEKTLRDRGTDRDWAADEGSDVEEATAIRFTSHVMKRIQKW